MRMVHHLPPMQDMARTLLSGFTDYYKPFAICVKALRREVFPNNQRWKTEDERLYSAMEAVLEKAKRDSNVVKN